MSLLLADIKVDHSDHENYAEEDEGGCGSATLLTLDRIVDISYHCVKTTVLTAGSRHIFSEYTDYAGVFLESSDESGDNYVSEHGREQRNRDLCEYADTGSAVDLSCIVILLVDALQTAKKNKDLEGECIPYYINSKNENVVPPGRARVDPVDRLDSEETQEVVDDTCRSNYHILGGGVSNDVEHCRENHSDSYGVGNVGQEEYSLQESLQGLDSVKAYRNDQREDRRKRNSQHAKNHGVFKTGHKAFILNDLFKVTKAPIEAEPTVLDRSKAVVILLERHNKGVYNGPECEDKQQHYRGSKV